MPEKNYRVTKRKKCVETGGKRERLNQAFQTEHLEDGEIKFNKKSGGCTLYYRVQSKSGKVSSPRSGMEIFCGC